MYEALRARRRDKTMLRAGVVLIVFAFLVLGFCVALVLYTFGTAGVSEQESANAVQWSNCIVQASEQTTTADQIAYQHLCDTLYK